MRSVREARVRGGEGGRNTREEQGSNHAMIGHKVDGIRPHTKQIQGFGMWEDSRDGVMNLKQEMKWKLEMENMNVKAG